MSVDRLTFSLSPSLTVPSGVVRGPVVSGRVFPVAQVNGGHNVPVAHHNQGRLNSQVNWTKGGEM
jgi:hypothetical protein